jgi:hypothetical protein
MPETDSTGTATWPLPRFDHIEIIYTTEDRFGPAAWGLNPDEQHAQHFRLGRDVGVAGRHGGLRRGVRRVCSAISP